MVLFMVNHPDETIIKTIALKNQTFTAEESRRICPHGEKSVLMEKPVIHG